MKHIGISIVVLLGLLSLSLSAHAQGLTTGDVCFTYGKASKGVVISTATDTQLVAPVAGTSISVCNCSITQAGGTGTVYFESATAASCGGTLAQQSGTMTANTTAGTSTTIVIPAADTTYLQLPTGAGLCVHSTGTIVQGVTCSYVQK